MNPSKTVRDAIRNTKKSMPQFWRRVLLQRSGKDNRGRNNFFAAGSIYENFTPTELETALLQAKWHSYQSRFLRNKVKAYVAKLPGIRRIVSLNKLPPRTIVVLDDRKKTGTLSCLVAAPTRVRRTNKTVMILKKNDNTTSMVVTFHPGVPIPPSSIVTHTIPFHRVTVSSAIRFGFKYAKIGTDVATNSTRLTRQLNVQNGSLKGHGHK